jgi:hypothetical protein
MNNSDYQKKYKKYKMKYLNLQKNLEQIGGAAFTEFVGKKVESLRTQSVPSQDYSLFKFVNFNNLKIMYIGSITDHQGIRDIIIVKFPSPYLLDMGGREKNTQVFYRSTGTNSGVRHSWFPMNGIVSPMMWYDKGNKLKGPIKKTIPSLSSRRPSWEIISPLKGGDSPLFYEYSLRNRHWPSLKNIVDRFNYDKFMEISLILGGGKLWEGDEVGISLRNDYFKNKTWVKKMYDIPTTRTNLSVIQINSIIGKHTEYGIPFDRNFFSFQNQVEPFHNILTDLSKMIYSTIDEISKEGKYDVEEFGKLIELTKSIDQRYKILHQKENENNPTFGVGAGSSTTISPRRGSYDIGLPSGNILWMYSVTTPDERIELIRLLQATTNNNATHPEINSSKTLYMEYWPEGTDMNYWTTVPKLNVNLVDAEPRIIGDRTWDQLKPL